MRRLSITLAVAASLVAAGHASAATYYVSANGSDSNPGTSSSSPWRTVAKVDNTRFAPGDNVLFAGGQTFGDSTLMPLTSGTASAPITFSSYGSGRATISNSNGAVWFAGASYLSFDNLDLTTGGASSNVFAGSGSAGSNHIVLRDSVVRDGAGLGLISPSAGDSAWTIENNTFRNLGDSGLIVFGSNVVIRGNTISHVGVNSAITYGKHGIYAKGPDMTIANNDISDVTNGQAVSIRFHGARVYGNNIHDTAYAFAFFDYDTAPAPQGTSYIYGNRMWNISGYGFYYDNAAAPDGSAPTVDFVVASNTFSFSSASEAVNVSPSGSAHVTLANNIFTGSYGSALRAAATTVENHNDWYGAGSNVPHNTGDTTVGPNLGAAPSLALPTASPLVDAGVSLAQLGYTASCTGSPLSYCGSAPDVGAVESTPALVAPLAPPSSLTATNVTATGLTLQWAPSPDSRTIGYRVSAGTSVVATPTATSASISALACGTSYPFSVVAVDVTGAISSPAAASVTTGACPVSAPTPSPTPTPTPAPAPDTTPPSVAIASPAANTTVPLSFVVSASAKDAGGIARVVFSVDGRTWCTVTVAPYSCPVSVKNGWHSLTAAAVDTAGNSASKTIRVNASHRLRQLARVIAASPSSGARVGTRFVVHARALAPHSRPVVFLLDGRIRCVDRVAPYACTLSAPRGWHVVGVHAGAAQPLHLQLQVR